MTQGLKRDAKDPGIRYTVKQLFVKSNKSKDDGAEALRLS
jgi:hypothetical protein